MSTPKRTTTPSTTLPNPGGRATEAPRTIPNNAPIPDKTQNAPTGTANSRALEEITNLHRTGGQEVSHRKPLR